MRRSLPACPCGRRWYRWTWRPAPPFRKRSVASWKLSGTGIPLLAFPGADPAALRGQAFFGRAAEYIEDALSKCGARCCLVPSGLCVIPREGLPVSITLTEEDLTAPPSLNSGGDMVLQTGPAGWTLGKYAEVRCGEVSGRGVIAERLLNLVTGEGPWRAELIVEMMRDG